MSKSVFILGVQHKILGKAKKSVHPLLLQRSRIRRIIIQAKKDEHPYQTAQRLADSIPKCYSMKIERIEWFDDVMNNRDGIVVLLHAYYRRSRKANLGDYEVKNT